MASPIISLFSIQTQACIALGAVAAATFEYTLHTYYVLLRVDTHTHSARRKILVVVKQQRKQQQKLQGDDDDGYRERERDKIGKNNLSVCITLAVAVCV